MSDDVVQMRDYKVILLAFLECSLDVSLDLESWEKVMLESVLAVRSIYVGVTG